MIRFSLGCGLTGLVFQLSVGAATVTVLNTSDAGPGSLRQAVQSASAGDVITFAGGISGTITLLSGELIVNKSLTLHGPGSSVLGISGNNSSRVLRITNNSSVVVISGLTIRDGAIVGATGTNASSGFAGSGGSANGAGIWNSGALTLSNCIVRDNVVIGGTGGAGLGSGNGGAGGSASGPGLLNAGTAVVVDCLFTNNLALGGEGGNSVAALGGPGGSAAGAAISSGQNNLSLLRCALIANRSRSGTGGSGTSAGTAGSVLGGALYNAGPMLVENCTIAKNFAERLSAGGNPASGAGIYNVGSLTVRSSTISSNMSSVFSGGLAAVFPGTCSLQNTIVAGNSASLLYPDISASAATNLVSVGFNLIGATNGTLAFTNGLNHDLAGLAGAPLNPHLGMLQDNGGPTPTMALLPGSPALDAGYSGGAVFDQRGLPRPFDIVTVGNSSDGSDIGAVELNPARFTVLNNSDSGPGSLRQAIIDTPAFPGGVISFSPMVIGTITLTSGPLVVSKPVEITGPGAHVLALSGNNSSRVLDLIAGNATVSGLTITRAVNGIRNDTFSSLRLSACIISSNAASGIQNLGRLSAENCAMIGNTSQPGNLGGALFNDDGFGLAGAWLTNCTISGNFAPFGGGIWNRAGVFLFNCTVVDNDAYRSGGIENYVDPMQELSGVTGGSSSIIAGNRAGFSDDVHGAFLSGGYNFVGRTNDSTGWGAAGDQFGRDGAPRVPRLSPLADHGGPTPTHAPLAFSPALDRGRANGLTRDQRGRPRPFDWPGFGPLGADVTDIGAFELHPTVLNLGQVSGQVMLSWLLDGEPMRLEAASNLVARGGWSDAASPVVSVGQLNTATDDPVGDRKFYRLASASMRVNLLQDFEPGAQDNYALGRHANAPGPNLGSADGGSTGRYLRLVTDGVTGQNNTISFDQTGPGFFTGVHAQFDFRFTSTDVPADGFAFLLIPTAAYGSSGPGVVASEDPNIAGAFGVGFDVYPNSPSEGNNDISVHWDGMQYANARLATPALASGNFHRCNVNITHASGGAIVAVTITPNINVAPGAPLRALLQFIAGLNPFESRVEFAARNGALNMSVDLDNIDVMYLSSPPDVLLQDYETSTPVNYVFAQINGSPGPAVQSADPGSTSRFLRLVHDNVNGNINAMTFNQTSPGLFRSIQAEFDFRLSSADAPADGFAFMIIPTAAYGTSGLGLVTPMMFEDPNVAGVFGVGFDVFPSNPSEGNNDVSLHWDGVQQANRTLAEFGLASGSFHRCKILLTHVLGGAMASVSLIPNINTAPGPLIRPIVAFIPELNPFDCRVEFAGRTGALNASVDLDNIHVVFSREPLDY